MKSKIFFFVCLSFWALGLQSQTATFITLDDNSNLYRVTIGSAGCTNTPLNLCNNFTGSPLSIALDGNKLYIVDNQDFLYRSILTNTGTANSCTKIGKFPTATLINGLTVGNGGIVYAASGSKIETYNPATNAFATLGSLPSQWTIGGDMLFYQGDLYEAVKINGSSTNCALIKINLANVASSTLYMNFNAGTNAFGFASVTENCRNNKAYALSNGTSTSKIYAVDMIAKTEATIPTCTLNYNVYDAASIAETQTSSPPNDPIVSSPVSYCQLAPVGVLTATTSSNKDTLRWYNQALGGTSYGSPTPALSSTTIGITNYFVSNFDTSTGCESNRSLIAVVVNPYPAKPIINPTTNQTICFGDSVKLTSSLSTNNQWLLNNVAITSATNASFFAASAGKYAVTTTGVGGCSKTSDSVVVQVSNATISYTGSPFCKTGFVAVNLSGTIGGKFIANSASLIIDSVSGTINLAASPIGNYTINYWVGSCKFVTNIIITNPIAAISYNSNVFCKANATQTAILATGTPTGGVFSASPAGLSINATTGAIAPATSLKNNYIVTYAFGTMGVGCGVQTATTNLSIVDTTTSILNKSICSGNSFMFNGSTYNLSGTYNFKTTNATGCDSVATLVLTILPKLSSTNPKTICQGDSILFNGTYYKTAGNYNFITTNATGCDSIATLVLAFNQPSSSTTTKTICKGKSYLFNGFNYSTTGNYTSKLSNAKGCDSLAILNLWVDSFATQLSATPNPVFSANNVLAQLTSLNGNIVNSLWQPSSLFINNLSSQNIKAPDSSFTIVTIANSINGCSDTNRLLVVIKHRNNLVFVPNIMLPNSVVNSENKTCKVYGLDVKTATLLVYNQWGQKIAELPNAHITGWDGFANGQMQQSGVYVYVAKIVFKDETTTTKSGTVNLIR
jgi:Ig-like domain CHU_C associated/CHU_C Type IX secretion signal domain